ncbi:MAG: 16S rRNA (adenine(1518)-N(6)/adenine(1519)-N(6))-dimethyltransferase RsmA [Spirochaetaceae bacterium]|nr:16S rRNA (adenine(1518)-N(6)/adenine(1519)-N(6))-dimethyltransferase RsmA [Spirochaetaceae bacterium]
MNDFINYDSPSEINAFLRERGMGAQKKFGQNFLINRAARERLLSSLSPAAGEEVWEIGPGLGAMTSALLSSGALVRAFEVDRGFCAVLRERFSANPAFSLIEGDALKTLGGASSAGVGKVKLFGNLPYNIAARLIAFCVERGLLFPRVVLTVQREVARRIAAGPGSADYSSLSVLVSSAYDVRLLSVLKGECFFPVPHVESQALRLELKPGAVRPQADFFLIVRALFASRRKTIKNNLAAFLKPRGLPQPEAAAAAILERASLHGGERAERLCVVDFLRITEAFGQSVH